MLSIKHQALKAYLEEQNTDQDEIGDVMTEYDCEDEFHANGEDLLILFDDEADERCHYSILDSIWAFNADFIASHVNDNRIDDYGSLIKSIQAIQEQCESANSAVKAMIDDLDTFVEDAISADGRGHFISYYDGHEHEFSVRIMEKLEASSGHPTFVDTTHWIYIYRV